MTTSEGGPKGYQDDHDPRSIPLIERFVDVFIWAVKAVLIIAIILTVIYGLLIVVPLFRPVQLSSGESVPFLFSPSDLQRLFDQLTPLFTGFWDLLRPALLLVIVIVLIRWLVTSSEGKVLGRVGGLLSDIPSLIAVLIIGTISIITILGIHIPEALGNIALVIVGFYFGQERERRVASRRQDEAKEGN